MTCAAGALMLVACATQVGARPAVVPQPSATLHGGDAHREIDDAAVATCTVKSAHRTWVPFAPDHALDDFEQTAVAVRQLLGYVKAKLCALAPGLDPSGALHQALQAGTTEIVAVEFSSAELTSAIVTFGPPPSSAGAATSPASTRSFSLQATLSAEAWHLRLIEIR
jgi:hypothetical protein